MENKSTTKATMRKAHFIGSMIPSEKFPVDIAEFVLELSPEEFTTWNTDTLHELEYNFFQIPQKKIFEKIEFFIQTIEVESDGDNQLLTIRFILVGDLKINEMEDIGVAFRNQILTEFGGNLFLKLNKQVDPLDFIITISPLQDPYNVMLTRNEVATMFKVHISTVDNWSSNETLIPLGLGGKVYFRLSDIYKSITPLNL